MIKKDEKMTIKEILQGKPYYIEKKQESNPIIIPGKKKGLFKKRTYQGIPLESISYTICLINSVSPTLLTCTAHQNIYEVFMYNIIIDTQKQDVNPQVAKAFFNEVEQLYNAQEAAKKEAELNKQKQPIYNLLQQKFANLTK